MRYVKVLSIPVFLLFAATSFAHVAGKVDVRVVSDSGAFHAIPFKYYTEGRTHIVKTYLEARRGEDYGIVLRNNLAERVGVVIAVDGRNIISGEKSSLTSSERMYILEPRQSTKIEGWRTDDNTVHAFYFTDVGDSYAVRTFGDSSAMGVIAVAVFREKERQPLYEQKMNESRAAVPPSGAAAESLLRHKGDQAGTGFGDAKRSPVIKVAFDPESTPYEKVLLKYEWRETLCKKGLLRCANTEGNRLWDEEGYAPFPPGYDGR